MSEIDKILEALKRSFLYQINCELTEKQSKTLLEHIDDLHFAVNENTELNARNAELEAENRNLMRNLFLIDDTEKIATLNTRIAALKRVIEILEDRQREVKNILIDKNLYIDSLYEEGFKLQHRIAELEAEIAKMKKYFHKPAHGTCCTCQKCGHTYDECRCDFDEALDDLDKANTRIAELEEAQRWIPVSERLPEVGKVVHVIDMNDTGGHLCNLYETAMLVEVSGNKRFGFIGHSGWDTSDVTHWMYAMPLPEPPEVQE